MVAIWKVMRVMTEVARATTVIFLWKDTVPNVTDNTDGMKFMTSRDFKIYDKLDGVIRHFSFAKVRRVTSNF